MFTSEQRIEDIRTAIAKARGESVLGSVTGTIGVDLVEWLLEQLDAQKRELQRAKFSPMGDNHHNALVCPYCGDLYGKQQARITELENRLGYAPRGYHDD